MTSSLRVLSSAYPSVLTCRFLAPSCSAPSLSHVTSSAQFSRCLLLHTSATKAAPKGQVYGERRLLGFSAPEIFSVVSQVDRYHSFVPWCKKSVVVDRNDSRGMKCELVIGFPPIGEAYTSYVTLFEPYLVTSICTDMSLFDHLKTIWKFIPGDENGGDLTRRTCQVDFAVSFQFTSSTNAFFSRLFFDEVIRKNVDAFLHEAERRHGPESIPRQKPVVYAKR